MVPSPSPGPHLWPNLPKTLRNCWKQVTEVAGKRCLVIPITTVILKNISYLKLPQIIPKLYVLTAATTELQPEGREKNTVQNTALGEGKPWPESLW